MPILERLGVRLERETEVARLAEIRGLVSTSVLLGVFRRDPLGVPSQLNWLANYEESFTRLVTDELKTEVRWRGKRVGFVERWLNERSSSVAVTWGRFLSTRHPVEKYEATLQ